MTVSRALSALALVSAALFAAPSARAQISDADRASARTLAIEGQDALDKKDFAAAADRFKRASAIVNVPTLLLGLGRAYVGLGRLVAAQELFNRIVREGAPAGSPPVFLKAVEDAGQEAEKLVARVPSVVIEVKGADSPHVTIDDVPVPAAALGTKRLLDPGRHKIRATAPGMANREVEVDLAEGKSEKVELELKPGDPGSPAAAPPVAPAPQPAEAARSEAADGGAWRRTAGFVAIGVGGASLAMGAITGGIALGKHGSLSDACKAGKCPPSAYEDLDGYHLMGTLSTIGFVAGAALAGGGVVLLITAPKAKPKSDAWISPLVAPGYLGASGRF